MTGGVWYLLPSMGMSYDLGQAQTSAHDARLGTKSRLLSGFNPAAKNVGFVQNRHATQPMFSFAAKATSTPTVSLAPYRSHTSLALRLWSLIIQVSRLVSIRSGLLGVS